MTAGRRVTIREVADAAGVSTQTVSRVLNNRPDVAAETFERVQRVIADTGYAPNMLARGLTQGRSHTLGIVTYGLDYFGPSRVLTGIERRAAELGYAISLTLLHEPGTVDVDGILNGLVGRQVDGIIWAIAEIGGNLAWSHEGSPNPPVPVALVGGMAAQTSWPSIGIDNRAIGRVATEHLIAGGARRVATVTGPLDWWEAQERLHGWREVLDAHGIGEEDRLVVEGDWGALSGELALERLLEGLPGVDAVFASNDQMALGILHAAHQAGLRIPDDLSVVGVDDMPESSHFWPSLTTVHQPLRDAGAMAVEELDRWIPHERQPRKRDLPGPSVILLQPTLIVRASSRHAQADPSGGRSPAPEHRVTA
jgi:LacI family transcriptional regulator